jgi:hypothetical protein
MKASAPRIMARLSQRNGEPTVGVDGQKNTQNMQFVALSSERLPHSHGE